MPVDRYSLSHNIRNARLARNLSQTDLATLMGVSTETISRFERGAFEPALSTAYDLCRALDMSLDALCVEVARPVRAGIRIDDRARPGRPRGRADAKAAKPTGIARKARSTNAPRPTKAERAARDGSSDGARRK